MRAKKVYTEVTFVGLFGLFIYKNEKTGSKESLRNLPMSNSDRSKCKSSLSTSKCKEIEVLLLLCEVKNSELS